jgi:hypothetical protein
VAARRRLRDFEGKVKALEPQLVRIFYNDNWDGNWDGKHPEWPQNYASFVKVVRLAQESGATIDISFQNLANAKAVPAAAMAKFADVIEDLNRNNGLTNVRWVEVGNEPNSGTVTLEEVQRALQGDARPTRRARAPRPHPADGRWPRRERG